MTKSTITRERLEQLANFKGAPVTRQEEQELARMALAAMDSESGCLPLDYLQGHKDDLEWAAQLAEANHPETGDWLYADPIELAKAIRKGPDMPPAQLASVVQDIGEIRVGRRPTMNQDECPGLGDWWVQLRIGEDSDEVLARVYGATPQEANNRAEALARRAAMLQAEPVTANRFPEYFDFDRFNDVVWLEAVASNPHMHSITTSTIAMVALELNKKLEAAGNSPVIPDGWQLVPVEPNGDMLAAAQDAYGETEGDIASTLRAAIAAALHDTPALNSVQSVVTVSDAWIPVSERMPIPGVDVLVAKEFFGPGDWRRKVGHVRHEDSGWNIYGASWAPTHWMPLPAAPQEASHD
ncbi:DUF551 domain-containing protein [Klebsiella oxytoca]